VYNRYLVIIGTLALSVILHLSIPYDYVYAQGNQSGENSIFTPDNNMTDETSNNNTGGIMKNTSGLLDDAFDTLRDTFGSFFGK
jgi:hypothetical protein